MKKRDWADIPIPHSKQCASCGELKGAAEFYRKKTATDGLNSRCKACERKATAAFNAKNPARALEKVKQWQAKNPAAVKAIKRRTWARNRERYLAERRAAYAENRNERRRLAAEKYAQRPDLQAKAKAAARRRYELCADEIKAYQVRYRQENPDKVLALAHDAIARRAKAPGKTTAADWAAILEEFDHCCAYCLGHTSKVGKLSREHMKPLTRGGSNWPDNLVPACKSCNSRKNTKTVAEFARFSCRALAA